MSVARERDRRPVIGTSLPVGIYTRVSDTDEDHNGLSHEFQEGPCRARGAALGYAGAETFSDNFSGRYLYERPGLSRLREAVRAGQLGAVIVWKIDRISRQTAQRAIVVQEFRQHGCPFLSATEEISDSPEGRLLETILGGIAEFEVERTLERSQAALAVLRARRVPIGAGLARFGYRYDLADGRRARVVVEAEARVVRGIFERYLLGDSSISIAARLDALGEPPPAAARGVKLKVAGTRWQPSTVRAILRDASYVGAPMTAGKKRCTGEVDASGNARTARTDPSEWWTTAEETPAIVDPDAFARVQVLLKAGSGTRRTRNGDHPYLLRGMVTCATCGRTCSPQETANNRGTRYAYFVCNSVKLGARCGSRGTPVRWLDGVVWDAVVAHIADRSVIESRFEAIAREHRLDDLDRDRAAHEGEVEAARAAIRRLTVRLEATDDPELIAPFEARLAELRASIAAHQAEVAWIDGKLTVVRNRKASLDRWWRACERGRADLARGAMSFEQKRLFLQALDVRVVADRRDVQLHFGIPLAEGEELVIVGSSPARAPHNDQQRLTFTFSLTG